MSTDTVTTQVESAPPSPSVKPDRHVHELDIVRILTFACVIAVHTISYTNVGTNPVSNGFEMLLHYTREAFFFLTGFVLMHQYGNRSYNLIRFYRRRILLVGGPYLAWTVLYTLWRPVVGVNGWSAVTHQLWYSTIAGTAWFHLYFLLVSLQIYLLFPLISRLVNATRQHHLWLLGASAVIELGFLWYIRYDQATTGWASHLNAHQDVFIWNYQFWILLGAVAAMHRAVVTSWIARHRKVIALLAVIAAAIALARYCRSLMGGVSPGAAASVLQPVMLIWSCAAIAGLFAIGTVWKQHRRVSEDRSEERARTGANASAVNSKWQRAVDYASDRSFGIFLVHPFVLSALLAIDHNVLARHVGNPELSVLVYLIVVVGAVALTELLRRSPASLILTGRPQLRHRRPPISTGTLDRVGRTESATPIG